VNPRVFAVSRATTWLTDEALEPTDEMTGSSSALGSGLLGAVSESTPMKNNWERKLFYLLTADLMGDPPINCFSPTTPCSESARKAPSLARLTSSG
jgi:hypothetical protein